MASNIITTVKTILLIGLHVYGLSIVVVAKEIIFKKVPMRNRVLIEKGSRLHSLANIKKDVMYIRYALPIEDILVK
jgi:hypothetical protein